MPALFIVVELSGLGGSKKKKLSLLMLMIDLDWMGAASSLR
jgi:hypothetical protein